MAPGHGQTLRTVLVLRVPPEVHVAKQTGHSIEVQRALYRLLGIKPDNLQRVLIDISHDAPIQIYVQSLPADGATDELLDEIRLSFPKVERVKFSTLDSEPVELSSVEQLDLPPDVVPDTLVCEFAGFKGCDIVIPHSHMVNGDRQSFMVRVRQATDSPFSTKGNEGI